MEVFLDSPQDFGKSRTRKIKTVSAGAFFRVAFKRVEAPEVFLAAPPGRKVAAVPDQHATSLFRFAFRADEIIVFGSEGRGIRPEVLALCDERVTIPNLAKNRATPALSGDGRKAFDVYGGRGIPYHLRHGHDRHIG